MKTDIDHVHFLIRYIPCLSIVQIVHSLKQESTRLMLQQNGGILRKLYWYQNLLWSDGHSFVQ